jgi:integrase
MSADDLLLRVECYVAVRRALGYAVRSEEKLLKDFVQFLELNGASGPIRAQTAIEWACAPAPGRGPSGEASRLKVVRRFLSHLQAFEFETEVPGPGVLPAFRRPLPYLYSADEIATLMKEASHLGPKDSLRPYTYVALIGLLASSGLRVGETLRLKVEEVRLSCSHPRTYRLSKPSSASRVWFLCTPPALRRSLSTLPKGSVWVMMHCRMLSSCLRRVVTSAIGHVGTRSLGSLTVLGFASAQALVGPAFIAFDMVSRSVGWSNGTTPE